jgi:hypothetical protein
LEEDKNQFRLSRIRKAAHIGQHEPAKWAALSDLYRESKR